MDMDLYDVSVAICEALRERITELDVYHPHKVADRFSSKYVFEIAIKTRRDHHLFPNTSKVTVGYDKGFWVMGREKYGFGDPGMLDRLALDITSAFAFRPQYDTPEFIGFAKAFYNRSPYIDEWPIHHISLSSS